MRESSRRRKLTRCLEDLLVEVSATQLLGQAIGIVLVALRPSARRDSSNDELVDVRPERLVQPNSEVLLR